MKTMKLSKQVFLLSVLFLGMSCNISLFGVTGKGNVASQKRAMSAFTSIELLSAANVEVVKGTGYEVIVSDYENIVNYVTTSVVNGQLVISTDPSVKINRSNPKVMVIMPELSVVSHKGDGDVEIKSNFESLNSISVSGKGNLRATNCCGITNLDVFTYGGGSIDLKGNVQNLKAVIAGSGNLNLFDLQAKTAECIVFGSGNIEVNAEKELSATNSGEGSIIYKGEPVVAMNLNGAGSVKRF